MGAPSPQFSVLYEYSAPLTYFESSSTYRFYHVNAGKTGPYVFGSSDLVSRTDTSVDYDAAFEDHRAVLSIENPSARFQYSRRLVLAEKVKSTANGHIYCVFGVPSRDDDPQLERVATFSRFAVKGRIYDYRSGTVEAYAITDADVDMTVDLDQQQMISNLTVRGKRSDGKTISFGPLRYTAGLGGAAPSMYFSTDLVFDSNSPTSSSGSGGAYGIFFGPGRREFGYAFRYQHGRGGVYDLTFAGTVMGVR